MRQPRAKDGSRAGDLLKRDFAAPAPNRAWVMDFTYVRAWSVFTYVAFVVDVFALRIVACKAATSKDTDLVMAPRRVAMWQRDRDGHPIVRLSVTCSTSQWACVPDRFAS